MEPREFEMPADLEVGLNRYRRAPHPMSLPKIIPGILIVAFGIFLGRLMYAKYMIYEVTQSLGQFNARVQAGMQAQIDRSRQQQLAIERERTRRTEMEIQARQAETDRQNAAQAEARRKEAAWNRYYKGKRPAWCDQASTDEAVVECGNIYMRERAKFEKAWGG